MQKIMIMACPSGRINTEEKYLWCMNEGRECQNVNICKCSFKGKMIRIANTLKDVDREEFKETFKITEYK